MTSSWSFYLTHYSPINRHTTRTTPQNYFVWNRPFDNRCCFLAVPVFWSQSWRLLWFGNLTQCLYQLQMFWLLCAFLPRFARIFACTNSDCSNVGTLICNLLILKSTEFVLERTTQWKSVKVQYKPCSSATSLCWTMIHGFHVAASCYHVAMSGSITRVCSQLTIKIKRVSMPQKKSTEHPTSSPKMFKARVSWLTGCK